jgi:probable rRNA maturation factor
MGEADTTTIAVTESPTEDVDEPPAVGLRVEVVVHAPEWQRHAGEERLSAAMQHALMVAAPERAARAHEVVLVLSDDTEVRGLSRRYRGKDKPTNVLSFPAGNTVLPPDGASIALGDVVLARETVEREAGEAGIPVLDHACHLAVHGLLHLIGYDHESDSDAEAMETMEIRILADLGIPDPYARFDGAAAPELAAEGLKP